MSGYRKLTENLLRTDHGARTHALLKKWEETTLLEGLKTEHEVKNMVTLLENEAIHLHEATAMSQGDIEGFSKVAFPLVRRVFGNLVANELVSVQAMSQPTGLVAYIDFVYTDTKVNAGAVAGESIYGGNRVASQLTGGVDLDAIDETNDLYADEKSFYSLNNGYSAPTASAAVTMAFVAARSGSGVWDTTAGASEYRSLGNRLILDDPKLSGSVVAVYSVPAASFTNLSVENLTSIHTDATGTMSPYTLVRAVNQTDPVSGSSRILLAFATNASGSEDTATDIGTADDMDAASKTFTYSIKDAFIAGGAVGSVVGTNPWGLEGSPDLLAGESGLNVDIPEIEMKLNTIAVTAQSRKLKAKWSPESAIALNSYYGLDAESELTTTMSDHVAHEIDAEILQDLTKGANAAKYFWSRKPGKFVNRITGQDITNNGAVLPDFTGNVSEWYETLLETINDASAQIHRKTRMGGATFLVTSPEVASILETTSGWRANIEVDAEKGSAGAVQVGSISNKWDVYVTPYMYRNVVLLGHKGEGNMKAGYVYAPFVPMQISPTILGVEDFTPRRAIATWYANQMLRKDFYALVVVKDLLFK